jgi:hypothetical protein
MFSRSAGVLALLVPCLLAAGPRAAAADYSVKAVEAEPPKELADPVRALLGKKCVQFLDGGTVLSELWFRSEMPLKGDKAEATRYDGVAETTVFGAVRVAKQMGDYRKQKIPPGVYTLRFANQPKDGDHMGTAFFSTFLLLTPAKDDQKPDLMEPEKLHEESAKTTKGHPAVWLLFPGTGAGDKPKLVNKGRGHWVLYVQIPAKAGDKKGTLSIGLVLIGNSPVA